MSERPEAAPESSLPRFRPVRFGPSRGALPRLYALRRVQAPKAFRWLARFLSALVVLTGLALGLAPWQQTASGIGQVLAYAPMDREQTIDSPISGRVVAFFVVEGSVVKQGDPIAEVMDIDPNYVQRLEETRQAIEDRIDAANERAASYERQVGSYEKAKDLAVEAAELKIKVATQKIESARQKVAATEAELNTARLNLVRTRALIESGLASQREMELADLAVAKADTELNSARAALISAQAAETGARATRYKTEAEASGKIDSSRAEYRKALSEAAYARGELAKNSTDISRQSARKVMAPRDGVVLRLSGHTGGKVVKQGDMLAVLVPTTGDRAAEFWIDGNDAPLITNGSHVRIQFEGWPAVQFAGWPSVAVGTFGGKVAFVDALSGKGGKFRVLVVPDESNPDDEPWPNPKFLRQGVRAKAWVFLSEVALGYELWRQLNGFPPAVAPPTDVVDAANAARAPKDKAKDDGGKDGDGDYDK
jgi:membrane fusion protein, adhesin transport system